MKGRNPKAEVRKKSEFRIQKHSIGVRTFLYASLSRSRVFWWDRMSALLRHSDFGLRPSFGFRISAFGILFSVEPGQAFFNPTRVEHVESVRFFTHRAGVELGALIRRDEDYHTQRYTQNAELAHKFAAIVVPGEEHANAAAQDTGVVENQMFQRGKRLVLTGSDRGQNFQHLVRPGQSAPGG